ncbi:MAG: hypothetical protein PHQ23_15460, partial [Candidatus Wallbacteria bacterium]|nr:hypothetical protein [Candidatus Wallbacteria bacterium]
MKDLLQCLLSSEFSVRRNAVIKLAKLDDMDGNTLSEFYLHLKKIALGGDRALVYFVRKALSNLERIDREHQNGKETRLNGQVAREQLIQSLGSDDKVVRMNALEALAR